MQFLAFEDLALAAFDPGTNCMDGERCSTGQKLARLPVTHYILIVEVIVVRYDVATQLKYVIKV